MTADARWIHQVDQLEAHVNELLTDLGLQADRNTAIVGIFLDGILLAMPERPAYQDLRQLYNAVRESIRMLSHILQPVDPNDLPDLEAGQ